MIELIIYFFRNLWWLIFGKRNSKYSKFFDFTMISYRISPGQPKVPGTTERLNSILDDYVKTIEITEEFFEELTFRAKVYVCLDKIKCNNYLKGLIYFQLSAVIQHPIMIMDKRVIPILVLLKKLRHNMPVSFEMYTDFKYGKGVYVLRSGFGKQHIVAFERIVDEMALWKQKNDKEFPDLGTCEFKRIFFGSIAHAVKLLSKKYPEETFELRIKMLERNLEFGYNSYVPFYLLYSFKTEEEICRLQKIATEDEENIKGKYAHDILSSAYDGVLWAI